MPKFIVTMTLYQHCIVEAEDMSQARDIANYETDDDDWDDPVVGDDLEVTEYNGSSPAFNQD